MSKKHKKSQDNFLILAFIIFIVIVVYLFSLGNFNFSNKIDKNKTNSIDESKRKHKRLKEHLDKQKNLELKLSKIFKRTYFAIRLLFILAWSGIVFILYKNDFIFDLEDFLNYSQALLLILVVANFLTFGNLNNLKAFLSNIKNRLENRIWGKYINLSEKIGHNEVELKSLEDKTTLNKLTDGKKNREL